MSSKNGDGRGMQEIKVMMMGWGLLFVILMMLAIMMMNIMAIRMNVVVVVGIPICDNDVIGGIGDDDEE